MNLFEEFEEYCENYGAENIIVRLEYDCISVFVIGESEEEDPQRLMYVDQPRTFFRELLEARGVGVELDD